MAKKTKSLGPANDKGVPGSEILLAKIVQNAKARDLGVVWGPAYYNCVYSVNWEGQRKDGPGPACCCALGAAEMEKDTCDMTNLSSGHEDWIPVNVDVDTDGYEAGAVFADAMGGRIRQVVANNGNILTIKK